MEARVLVRTRSLPLPSPIASIEHDAPPRSVPCWTGAISPRSAHLELKDLRFSSTPELRRARSEASLIRSGVFATAKIKDEDADSKERTVLRNVTALNSSILSLGIPDGLATAISRGSDVMFEEAEFTGGGSGNGRKIGGGGRGGGGGGGDPMSEMGAYYKEMLRADPENPLILMNYGKFLHKVEGDLAGAEDCYSRAVLANPSDGEALSLYGNLMWEAHRDEDRAEDYLQRAVEASPEDCYVLGSYAHFLWDAEEKSESSEGSASAPAAATGTVMVEAF